MDRLATNFYGSALVDMTGREFAIGDAVARPFRSGNTADMEISRVTRIENGKMYLANSKVALHYPGRCLIVNELNLEF